jgi:hypothetical protein
MVELQKKVQGTHTVFNSEVIETNNPSIINNTENKTRFRKSDNSTKGDKQCDFISKDNPIKATNSQDLNEKARDIMSKQFTSNKINNPTIKNKLYSLSNERSSFQKN